MSPHTLTNFVTQKYYQKNLDLMGLDICNKS